MVQVALDEFLRQPFRFAAEDEVIIFRAIAVIKSCIGLLSKFRNEEIFAAFCAFEEVVKAVMINDIHELPIIEPRSF